MNYVESVFGSVAHSLELTLRRAKENGERHISMPKGTYHIYASEVAAPAVCVSNHGDNGFKPAALFIDEMNDLTFDGGGSKFILHGCMDFAIIRNSKNVTIKNLTVTCADTCNFQGRVIGCENGNVRIKLCDHPNFTFYGGKLFEWVGSYLLLLTRALDYVTDTKELRRGSGDTPFGCPINDIKKSLDGDVLTLYDVPSAPPVGDTVVFCMSKRINQAFLGIGSDNIIFEDITVNTCWGMAFIMQKCRDVTVRRCRVVPEDGRFWSAGQDATHFVNCRGTVTVRNCEFFNQLDDAVNIHGIYTVLEKVRGNEILVKYSHNQTRGIDIYGVGDKIRILERESQRPVASATVAAVDVISQKYTALKLTDLVSDVDLVEEEMIVENISDDAGAIISGNRFGNNRARGMLIAARGRVEITGNVFHSGGAAIQFESDPMFWLESGGVTDVVIRDNLFDDCRHGTWGRAVIDIGKRRKTLDDFYYHEKIEISSNKFTQTNVPCLAADNVRELVFEDNAYSCGVPFVAEHCFINGKKY